jgi:hypothetical protein
MLLAIMYNSRCQGNLVSASDVCSFNAFSNPYAFACVVLCAPDAKGGAQTLEQAKDDKANGTASLDFPNPASPYNFLCILPLLPAVSKKYLIVQLFQNPISLFQGLDGDITKAVRTAGPPRAGHVKFCNGSLVWC